MKMIWKISVWEIMRNLRNKQFIIGLLLTPIIFLFFGGLPALIERIDRPQQELYLVLDRMDGFDQLQELTAGSRVQLTTIDDKSEAEGEVLEGEADGFFVLDEELLETGRLTLYTEEQTTGQNPLQEIMTNYIQQERIDRLGLTRDEVQYITAPAIIDSSVLIEEAVREPGDLVVGIGMGAILFILIFSSGSMLLQSALQEKRDRMSEIILSSIDSNQLMQGKIIGHFLLGVIQVVFWLGLGLPLAWFFFDLPVLEYLLTPRMPVMLIFAMLGYLLFASLFVGIGATLEDLQSASNTQSMVFMLPILPVLFLGPMFNNPNGLVARLAGLFPLTSPVINIVRMGLTSVPVWELVLSMALLLLTAFILTQLAAKLFRVGMLMYGKNASPREILKWIRYRN